jgi:hypothetical protein
MRPTFPISRRVLKGGLMLIDPQTSVVPRVTAHSVHAEIKK